MCRVFSFGIDVAVICLQLAARDSHRKRLETTKSACELFRGAGTCKFFGVIFQNINSIYACPYLAAGSTHLKNISQIGPSLQEGVKIEKHI